MYWHKQTNATQNTKNMPLINTIFDIAVGFIEYIPKTCRWLIFMFFLLFGILYKVKDDEVRRSDLELYKCQKAYALKDSAYISTLLDAAKHIHEINPNTPK